jgi:N-methylhydantoinase B/oxoprolinase/acetone carboxylase alpha subunit
MIRVVGVEEMPSERPSAVEPLTAAIVSSSRRVPPYGLAGGLPGACGRNAVERADGTLEELPGVAQTRMAPGDVLVVETPGGGGHGTPPARRDASPPARRDASPAAPQAAADAEDAGRPLQ